MLIPVTYSHKKLVRGVCVCVCVCVYTLGLCLFALPALYLSLSEFEGSCQLLSCPGQRMNLLHWLLIHLLLYLHMLLLGVSE